MVSTDDNITETRAHGPRSMQAICGDSFAPAWNLFGLMRMMMMMMIMQTYTAFDRHRGISNVQTASTLISLFFFTTTASQDDCNGTSARLDHVHCHKQQTASAVTRNRIRHSSCIPLYDSARPCNKTRRICDRRPLTHRGPWLSCACTMAAHITNAIYGPRCNFESALIRWDRSTLTSNRLTSAA